MSAEGSDNPVLEYVHDSSYDSDTITSGPTEDPKENVKVKTIGTTMSRKRGCDSDVTALLSSPVMTVKQRKMLKFITPLTTVT